MKTILSFPMKIYQSNICGEDLAVTYQRFRCSRSSKSWSYRTRYPFPQFIQHNQVKMDQSKHESVFHASSHCSFTEIKLWKLTYL